MDISYVKLIEILKAADEAGLFDLKTSELAKINSVHRKAIRAELKSYDEKVAAIEARKTMRCSECGHLVDDPRCCQNDEELWK